MHETNTKQPTVRPTSRSNLAEASNPSGRRDESSVFRSRLFLKRFLRARRIMMSAKRALTVIVIGAIVLAAGSVQTLAVQQADAGQATQPAQQTAAVLQQLASGFSGDTDGVGRPGALTGGGGK